MRDGAISGAAGGGRIEGERTGHANAGYSDSGVLGQALGWMAGVYPIPPVSLAALVVAGVILGALGDALLRASDPPLGVNMSVWITSVAIAAIVLHRRAALRLDRERVVWLGIGVMFAAGLAWRDSPPLKLLALGCATLMFAIAAHQLSASWVRRAGVVRYAFASALGAFHAWTASLLVLADATLAIPRANAGRASGWRGVLGIVRGLAIAAPLILIFGALFVSADAVFAQLVENAFRFDFEWIVSHVAVFSILTWISTGYLRGFLTGTEPPPLRVLETDGALAGLTPKRPTLGITEIATVLAALDLLFLIFVIVQFRYLFGGDALVQVTPDLTYAAYARRGFFELVFAVVLVVPILLAADWLLDRSHPHAALVFRVLAGVQIALVMAITASALQRLRLYYASYGLTEARLYAMVLLAWIGAMLIWFAATVLRARRDSFAFGALTTGLATIALLFVINPDAIIARTNVTRMASADAPVRFDVAYATSLSADAVPVLIDALPALPPDVQCPLARRMLRRWPPDRERSIRNWNWSAARAANAVRDHEAELRSMVGPEQKCESPPK